jgi:hypothetical protein
VNISRSQRDWNTYRTSAGRRSIPMHIPIFN